MNTEQINQPLTNEEIQQVREMLANAQQRKQQTDISSKSSFLELIRTVPALGYIVEKITSLSWEKIFSFFEDIFH